MIDLDTARAQVLAAARPLPGESCALRDARGRRLAAAVVAGTHSPAADQAAMDGYAVRSADTVDATPERPVRLAVVGLARPGHPADVAVAVGEAVRIFTGATRPDGADSVVMQEATDAEDGAVWLRGPAPAGRHLRAMGSEYAPGHELLPAGALLTPAAVGLLASAGLAAVQVHRRPRVALLVTGDELTRGGPDANGPMLTAAMEEAGAAVVAVDTVGDDRERVAAWLTAAEADVLVSTGGASVGDYDLVPDAWEQVGVAARFHGVALKPGKPAHFGTLGDRLVFALPGTPLAALTTCEQLVVPALHRLAGGEHRPPRLRLPLAADYTTRRAASYLLRCDEEAGRLALPERQDTAMLREAARQGLVAELPGQATLPASLPTAAVARAEALAGRVLRPAPPLPAVVAVRGPSGSGKTRLLEQLIPRLVAAGLRVGTLKHTHHAVEPDQAGTDSARHAAAGASRVLLLGRHVAATFVYGPAPLDATPLGEWLESFAGQVDLLLIEGFRGVALPQVLIETGDSFALAEEREHGLRRWRLTRPMGDELTWPDELLAELAAALEGTS